MRCFPMFALALSLMACSNQAEGERCDLDNGDLDCESDLVCRSLQSLGGGEGAICCPEGTPTVAACSVGSLPLEGDEDDETDDDSEDLDASTDDDADSDDGTDAGDAGSDDADSDDVEGTGAEDAGSADAGDASAGG